MEYVLRSQSENNINYQLFALGTDDLIGYAEGTRSGTGSLVTVIKIFEPYHRQGLGYEAFVKVFEALGGHDQIHVIVGGWSSGGQFAYLPDHRSTNLRIFLKFQEEGLSPDEAALQTPTGKWAHRLGYTEVKVIKNDSEEAEVYFYRRATVETIHRSHKTLFWVKHNLKAVEPIRTN